MAHMPLRANYYAMKSVNRHSRKKVPQEHSGLITEEICYHLKCQFESLKFAKTKKKGCRMATTRHYQNYVRAVRTKGKFSMQHFNHSENMKEMFSGLMKQEINSST